VIIATRIGAGAAAMSAQAKPVLGQVASVTLGDEAALVRVDKNRALVALHVPPGSETTVAATLELMAGNRDAQTPALPAPGSLHARVAGSVLPVALGDVDATIALHGDAATITAALPKPSADVRAAFLLPPPPWACAFTDGAAASMAIPPLADSGLDAFRGPVVIAIRPAAGGLSLFLAGVPKDAAASASLEDTLNAAHAHKTEVAGAAGAGGGATFVLEGPHRRTLRAVSSPDLFAVGLGDVDLAGLGHKPCATAPHALSLRGPALAAVLAPALFDPRELVQALLSGEASASERPFAALRGIDQLDVDVSSTDGGLAVRAEIALRPVAE
ncbi:MAG TPA: hypothetical protein VGO62_06585, partial [Myxococcota bacterium]